MQQRLLICPCYVDSVPERTTLALSKAKTLNTPQARVLVRLELRDIFESAQCLSQEIVLLLHVTIGEKIEREHPSNILGKDAIDAFSLIPMARV